MSLLGPRKYVHRADDWIMRATGDLVCRTATMWRHGWFDRLPPCIDHAMVGGAGYTDARGPGHGDRDARRH